MTAIEQVRYNLDRTEKGLPLTIPWLFPRFGTKFFGWLKGSYSVISANTSQGKTKFAKFTVINSIRDFKLKYPDIPIKVYWFALEESREMFELSILSNLLYEEHKLQFSVIQLLSLDRSKLIRPVLDKIDICEKKLYEILSWIDIIENCSTPSSVSKYIDKEMSNFGKIVNGKFIYNNPEQYVFGVFDHYTFLEVEPRPGVDNATQNLEYFSKHICSRRFKDLYKMVWIGIQQQNSETERVEWYKGEAIVSKLEPSLQGLSISKNIAQDATTVIGLFRPNRYNKGEKDKPVIPKYEGYDVLTLRDTLMSAIVLKDRHYATEGNLIPLLFNGAINNFIEAPRTDSEELQDLYKQIRNNPNVIYK